MALSYSALLDTLSHKKFAPVYVLDGDEPFYIDKVVDFFEHKVLSEEERDFNLIVLYGKETSWQDVINAARRFPMFSEKLVVIIKEAGQLKDIGQLSNYLEQPSPTTILVIDHRLKDIDKRTKFAKVIAQTAVNFNSKKFRDEDLPGWIMNFGKSSGYTIPEKEADMLSVYLGNDLQKISNELEKVKINEPDLTVLTTQHIEKYIGISREYNLLEMADVMFQSNPNKLARMLAYFSANPKNAPMVLLIGTLSNYLQKVFLCYYSPADFQKDRTLGIRANHRKVAQHYNLSIVHRCIVLLEEFSHKVVGVDNKDNDTALLRELVGKYNRLLYNY